MLSLFSRVRFCATLLTVAHQAPLSMGFSRQEYWSGLPCPPPGDLPDPGIEPTSLTSPALAGRFFTTSATWEAPKCIRKPLLNKTFKLHLYEKNLNVLGSSPPKGFGAYFLDSDTLDCLKSCHNLFVYACPQPPLIAWHQAPESSLCPGILDGL